MGLEFGGRQSEVELVVLRICRRAQLIFLFMQVPMEYFSDHAAAAAGIGFLYDTFSTAPFSLPLSSVRS